MTGPTFDLDAFADALDRHGGDLAAWPAQEREAAEALLAGAALDGSPAAAAAALHGQVVAVETVLRRERTVLTAHPGMAAAAMRVPQQTVGRRTTRRVAWGAVAALVLAAGILTGTGLPNRFGGDNDDPAQVVASALGIGTGESGLVDGGATDVD